MSSPSPIGRVIAIAVALSWARPLQAQPLERSLGVSLGLISVNGAVAGISREYPFGIDGSLYLDRGFELLAHLTVVLMRQPDRGRSVVGIAPALGLRYLFWEELIRPYVGASLGYQHIFSIDESSNFVGAGANSGLEVLATETVAVGLRTQLNAWVSPGASVVTSFGALINCAVYF